MITSYTDALAHFLRIPKGTNLSSYTKLYFAFLLSGVFHALTQRIMPSPANITVLERTNGVLYFFVWQAAAITAEDFVQWVYRKAGGSLTDKNGKLFRRVVGHVWVIMSIWASLPLVGDCFLKMRMGADPFLSYSLSRAWVEKYVPVPP